MMERFGEFLGYWDAAMAALSSMGMTIALILMASIMAAAGGFLGWRMRLYGALVGGMLMNVTVKAMGGSFAAAFAAALGITAIAFAVGSAPFLLQVLKRVRHAR